MRLAIDIGNTQIVVGLFHQAELQNTWRVSTHPIPTPKELRDRLVTAGVPLDEFGVTRRETLGSRGTHGASNKAIVIASVVPRLTQVIRESLAPAPLHIIDHHWPLSFEIRTDSPEQVGTDRLVDAEAAIRNYGFPCIVVDCGTATTICAISKSSSGNAQFLGGAILPGLKLAMEALSQNTAQLFSVELTAPPYTIGRNTTDALRSGLVLGYASMIDGMIQRFKAELEINRLPVIATGGLSSLLVGLSKELTHFDPHLTLKGICYLYDAILDR